MQSSDRPAPTAQRAREVYEAFRDVMVVAEEHPDLSHRLASAEVVLNVHLRDAPGQPTLALKMDRVPIEVHDGAAPDADVELYMDTEDVVRFWTGQAHLAMMIFNREAEFRGPIRKVLRVVPIARRLFSEFELKAEGQQSAGTPNASVRSLHEPGRDA